MDYLNYAEVPLRIEEDINKEHTTWANGKCVKMDEERWVTYYVMHKTETRVEETHYDQYVEKEICLAVPVRVRKGDGTKELHEACQNDEVYNAVLPLFESDNIELMRTELIRRIRAYDKSDAVNGFLLDGESVWLDKDMRVGLMNSTQIQKAAGAVNTTLWFSGISYTIPCDLAIQMLSGLELYALECYNVTARHEAEALKLNSDFESYDYTASYPEKLNFKTK